ncbi:MAG TPA: uroporphyrinogen-III C-methyltransferase [Rhodanobacteraceae bacterium]|nr:uroporphyrinogen-III C-methyltransferase [Rhodanobacteraceae bacterium]
MSDQPAPSASAPQPPADRPAAEPPRPSESASSSRPPKPPKPPKAPNPRPGGALAVLALLLALLALAVVAYGGWQWREGRQARQQADAAVAQLGKQVDGLHQSVADARRQREAEAQTQQALQAANQTLQQQVAGLSGRVNSLEGAVAALSRHDQHGREAMALDQAAMLLRMGQQRYALFHDAAGAIKALTLADQTLAALGDPALAGVRQTLDAERKALALTHPASRADDLAALAHLRAVITTLPLKPLDTNVQPAGRGFWQRVWHALSTAVVVRRVEGSTPSRADARMARQLAALDVAQAQAARLAWDAEATHAALKRVARALDTVFDTRDADVREARATVTRLLAEKPVSPPHLGKALQELQDLRRVRDAADTPPTATPAPPASTPAETSA